LESLPDESLGVDMSLQEALAEVRRSILRRMWLVIDVDLSKYFDTIRHHILLNKIARRIQDPDVMHLIKQIIKVNGRLGIAQGGLCEASHNPPYEK
jgi:RNA-directed DNA polymerase